MIDRSHDLTVTRQARLLGISLGTVYYLPRVVSEADLALMRRLDELHPEHPFMGARMLRDQLHRGGVHVGRRHITTLMQRIFRRWRRSLAPASAHRGTRFTRTCFATSPSGVPIRSGRWTPRTFRWRGASCISPRWWT